MNLLLLWAPALVSAFFIPELLPERVLIPPYDAVGWYHHPVFLDMYYKIQSKKPQDEVGGHKIPNQWDVYLKYDSKITPEAHADWASYLHDEDTGGFHGVGHVFDYPLAEMKGYSGAFTNQTIEKIKKSEVVDKVEPAIDLEIHTGQKSNDQKPKQQKIKRDSKPWRKPRNPVSKIKRPENSTISLGSDWYEQTDATWGLSYVSKAPPNRYRYHRPAGTGIWIYVLDSGVEAGHDDFEDRVEHPGFDATTAFMKMRGVAGVRQTKQHGTHVASIAAGAKYGVAKEARIVDVKVLRKPEEEGFLGQDKVYISGISWAVNDIVAKKRVGRAVMNISWGHVSRGNSSCERLGSLINQTLDTGIPVVIAAGDNQLPVDLFCPAMVKGAISVGAIDQVDRIAKFNFGGSNWSRRIDIWAPGRDIEAARGNSQSDSLLVNGTSAAAPHVSGVIACLLAREGPRTPDSIWKRLEQLSVKDTIRDVRGLSSRILYNGAGHGPEEANDVSGY